MKNNRYSLSAQNVFLALLLVISISFIFFKLFPFSWTKDARSEKSEVEKTQNVTPQITDNNVKIVGENGHLRVEYQNPQNLERELFSLEYPNNWALEYTVFYDSNVNKMAELQGMNLTKEQTSCFQDLEQDSQGRLQVLSKNQITINGIEITEVVLSASPEGSKDFLVWSPHMYCIEHNDRYFTITFYSSQKNGLRESDFRSILTTVNFTEN